MTSAALHCFVDLPLHDLVLAGHFLVLPGFCHFGLSSLRISILFTVTGCADRCRLSRCVLTTNANKISRCVQVTYLAYHHRVCHSLLPLLSSFPSSASCFAGGGGMGRDLPPPPSKDKLVKGSAEENRDKFSTHLTTLYGYWTQP